MPTPKSKIKRKRFDVSMSREMILRVFAEDEEEAGEEAEARMQRKTGRDTWVANGAEEVIE